MATKSIPKQGDQLHAAESRTRVKKLPYSVTVNFQFMFFDRRFDELTSYAESMERVLVEEAKRLDEQVSKKLRAMSEERKQDYVDDMAEDWDQLASVFPDILRRSLLIQCAADFEHALMQLAKLYERNAKSKVTLADLRGEGIHKVKLYFEKVVNVKFPAELEEWGAIVGVAELRNQLVHNDSRLPTDQGKRKKLTALHNKWPDTLHFEEEKIVLRRGLTNKIVETYKCFMGAFKARLRL
jgi:hypothetical protein